MESVTTTEPFVTPSGDYLGVVLRLWLRRYWPLIALPLAAMLAVGILCDSRWLFVALIVGFIIVPMVLSGVYSRYLLTPEAARSVMRRRVEFRPDGSLLISYLPPLRRVTVDTPDGPEVRYETVEPSSPLPDPEIIEASRIARVSLTASYRVYHLDRRPLSIIIIPHSAIPLK